MDRIIGICDPMRYDTTLKEIFQALPQTLLKILVGQEGTELLTVEFPAVKKRLPDLVVRLMDGSIFHLELQNGPEPMAWRMLEYMAMIRQLYPQAPLQQMVLYVGPVASKPSSIIEETGLSFRYTVRDIRDIDCRHMLASPMLEENLLAILCRMENERGTIRRMLVRIGNLPAKARADALEKRVILAGLRQLETVIKQEVDEMVISVDVMENAFLRDVFGKGKLEGKVTLLLGQLEEKYGQPSKEINERLYSAAPDDLDRWSRRILKSDTLDDIFKE